MTRSAWWYDRYSLRPDSLGAWPTAQPDLKPAECRLRASPGRKSVTTGPGRDPGESARPGAAGGQSKGLSLRVRGESVEQAPTMTVMAA